jgi:hypothetical protein
MTAAKMNAPLDTSKAGRLFEKLVVWVSAFSIALTAGFLASLKQVNPAVQIQFSIASVITFLIAGTITVLFLRAVLGGNKRKRALWVVAAAIASVIGYFSIGIKNAARENRSDVIIGTVIAVSVLSFVAWLLWRVVQFLESDQTQNRDSS